MAQPHAKPGRVVDLRSLGSKLRDAKTTALITEEHFEAIRPIVHAGAESPPHDVSGNITLHCLEGQIVLGLAASEIMLKSGDWLYLKRVTFIEGNRRLVAVVDDPVREMAN